MSVIKTECVWIYEICNGEFKKKMCVVFVSGEMNYWMCILNYDGMSYGLYGTLRMKWI